MNRSLRNRYLIPAAVLALAIYHLYPPDQTITLGLDLRGGTAYTLELDLSQKTNESERKAAVEKAIEIVRKRLDAQGLSEPILQPSGANRIMVQIPGLSEDKK